MNRNQPTTRFASFPLALKTSDVVIVEEPEIFPIPLWRLNDHGIGCSVAKPSVEETRAHCCHVKFFMEKSREG